MPALVLLSGDISSFSKVRGFGVGLASLGPETQEGANSVLLPDEICLLSAWVGLPSVYKRVQHPDPATC